MLIKMPERVKNDKEQLSKLKNPTTVRSGGRGFLSQMERIKSYANNELAKYKDRYDLVTDEDTLAKYIDACIESGAVAIDTETTGLDPMLDDIVGVSLYTPNQKGIYIPISHIDYITHEVIPNQMSKEALRRQLTRLFEHQVESIMFNGVFDVRVIRHQLGVSNVYCTWDCYVGQRLLNENETENKLKKLHQKYVMNNAEDEYTFSDLFKNIKFNLVPLFVAVLYAGHDAFITYEFYEYQHRWLNDTTEREDMRLLYKDFREIEMPCLMVVADIEDNGITLDLDYGAELHEKYTAILKEKEDKFYKACAKHQDAIDKYVKRTGTTKLGNPINVSSPIQLAILLYDVLKIGVVDKKHPRGTGEDVLAKITSPIAKPIADAILEYRGVEKLLSTYIDKLPNCINPNDGRIHCKFNQYGAVTGRFSSKEPNLQNIPSHNKDIRKMFVAGEGNVLMSSDYSQQEPKCLSALCKQQGDPQMYDTFMAGKDLYAEIASKAFNLPYEECLEHFPKGSPIKEVSGKWYYASDDDYDKLADGETDVYDDGKDRRGRAKTILLGVLYGMSIDGVAEKLNCSEREAESIRESVFRGFPAIKRFEDESLKMAHDVGYVTTVAHRKRRLPELQLDEYEFKYKGDYRPSSDLLDFSETSDDDEVDEITRRKLISRLHNARKYKDREAIKEKAEEEGIIITDNRKKISDATRQCVNSRIQGSAGDLTKLALINLNNNERLKELGFKILIPIHDEVIVECPKQHARECSELLASIMSESAEQLLGMPVKCDVSITEIWYGSEVEV